MWAHVAAGVITAWGDLPSLWWDGARQWDLRDPANIAPAGWVEVTPTDRPADTATTTVEMIELVGGIPTQVWVPRDLTPAEIEAANASAVSLALAEGMVADKALVEAAITALATLLANSTTAGSYRSVLGLGTDPAGLTSLRAWRSQTNANIVTAASLKGLADLLISLVQLDIAQARETRRLARQVLRLTRVQTGDLSSADVGDDVG
jgi:hypothetical protein